MLGWPRVKGTVIGMRKTTKDKLVNMSMEVNYERDRRTDYRRVRP